MELTTIELGITLICIPYWWDESSESLRATIRVHRPELFTNQITFASPIPAVPPSSCKKRTMLMLIYHSKRTNIKVHSKQSCVGHFLLFRDDWFAELARTRQLVATSDSALCNVCSFQTVQLLSTYRGYI